MVIKYIHILLTFILFFGHIKVFANSSPGDGDSSLPKWLKDYDCKSPNKNNFILSKLNEIKFCKHNLGLRGCGQFAIGALFSTTSAIASWNKRKVKSHYIKILNLNKSIADLENSLKGKKYSWQKIVGFIQKDNREGILQLLKQQSFDQKFISAVENSTNLTRLGTSKNKDNPEDFLKQQIDELEENLDKKRTALSRLRDKKPNLTARAENLFQDYDYNSYSGKLEKKKETSRFQTADKPKIGNKLLKFVGKWGGPALLLVTGGEYLYNLKSGRNPTSEFFKGLAAPTACQTLTEQYITVDEDCKPVHDFGANTERFEKLSEAQRNDLFQRPQVCEYYKELYAQQINDLEEDFKSVPKLQQIDCSENKLTFAKGSGQGNIKDLEFDFSSPTTKVAFNYRSGTVSRGFIEIDEKADEVKKFCFDYKKAARFKTKGCFSPSTRNVRFLKKTSRDLKFARLLADFTQSACSDSTFPPGFKVNGSYRESSGNKAIN